MTPLESLLRAAEALADDVRRFFPTCGGEKLTALDAALARYRAEPDLDERVRRLEAIDADRGRIVGDSSAHVMRLEARVAKLESGTHGPWSAFAARAVREGQNEADVIQEQQTRNDALKASGDAKEAVRGDGPQRSLSDLSPDKAGPVPPCGDGTPSVSHPSAPASPASPPAFARETPRVNLPSTTWVGALQAERDAENAHKASPPPETRTDEEDVPPHTFYEQPDVYEGPRENPYCKAVPPAKPPKRETGIDREAIGRAIQNAERRAVGWAPLSDDERPSPSDMMHADAALALVSEHVARVEQRCADLERGRWLWRRCIWCEAEFEIPRKRDDVIEHRKVCPSNPARKTEAERDTLKAECERLREAVEAANGERDRANMRNVSLETLRDAATARADSAERKLSECEEDNSAWRKEALEQRVRAQKAEKERDEHANDARMLRSRVERLAAPRAPAEGIEKAKAMDPLLDALWKVFGPTYRSHRLDFDTVVHYHVNKHWPPSPATPGPIVMPELTTMKRVVQHAREAWFENDNDKRSDHEAVADACIQAIKAANPGRATVRAVTGPDLMEVGNLRLSWSDQAAEINKRIGFALPQAPGCGGA